MLYCILTSSTDSLVIMPAHKSCPSCGAGIAGETKTCNSCGKVRGTCYLQSAQCWWNRPALFNSRWPGGGCWTRYENETWDRRDVTRTDNDGNTWILALCEHHSNHSISNVNRSVICWSTIPPTNTCPTISSYHCAVFRSDLPFSRSQA